ncbi:MAG: VanW family protein [Candidatus Moraniibacteriota bacterium]|nr:MAG: VanW family protein [Candidatus Moranbacteria bacterium]
MSTKTLSLLFLFLCCFEGGFFASSENARAESLTPALSSIPQTLSLSWDNGTTTLSQEILSEWFHPTNTLRFQIDHQTEAFSPTLCPWKLFFCNFSLTEKARYSIGSETSFAFDETAAQQFLNQIREENRDNPIDAVFTVGENNTVSAFAPSRNGSELDTTAGLKVLEEALRTSHERDIALKIPSVTLLPKIASTDADSLGITQFLGEGRTSFAGSPKNRIFNIKRAMEQFQGTLIAPGEDFSFVKRLGEVDGEHGYLPELVIKRGRTEPEFGGGICQVSTTLFRAALNTGQKITERRNHAYPVSYYKPYGMDATIYIPKPDFRFMNNTSGHILVQVAIEGSELVFRFYGTPDGRSVSIDGPHILERSPDGAMKTVFTQTVLAADGSTMIEDTFKSSYDSPSKYPHPSTTETFTEKPKDWSEKQWSAYTKTGELPR